MLGSLMCLPSISCVSSRQFRSSQLCSLTSEGWLALTDLGWAHSHVCGQLVGPLGLAGLAWPWPDDCALPLTVSHSPSRMAQACSDACWAGFQASKEYTSLGRPSLRSAQPHFNHTLLTKASHRPAQVQGIGKGTP